MTGGVFTVTIWHAGPSVSGEVSTQETLLWDRKRDGGFPGMLDRFISPFLLSIYSISLYGLGSFSSTYCISGALKLTYIPVAEVKALKSLVRNVIAPERDLGHTDRALKKKELENKKNQETTEGKKDCEDCQ
jgi:predicted Rdx family selenoprotein